MKKITDRLLMTDYLRDESRKSGDADEVLFPESEEEVISILKKDPAACLTTQGSRTGLTAGCVPFGGSVISMERMNKVISITDEKDAEGKADPEHPALTAVVQPGIALQVFRDELFKKGLFFTPDPTETSASIGGMISCNSSGARSYRYGAVRPHVRSIRAALRSGEMLKLTRGVEKACGLDFCLKTENGREIKGKLPDIKMPDVSKHTAGYYIRPDMDLIDLFIGAEGTLCIITEAELTLYRAPKHTWGCVVFFEKEDQAVSFVEEIRARDRSVMDAGKDGMSGESAGCGNAVDDHGYILQAEAIEYFDHNTLAMIRNDQLEDAVLQESETVPAGRCAVYIEHISEKREELLSTYGAVKDIVERLGASPAETWLAANIVYLEKLKEFRHAAPVCVNHRIAEIKKQYPEITKLGTDMSVPDGKLRDALSMYRQGLDEGGFTAAVFGHIGNNHLHVNIIPKDMDEYARGKDMYTGWAGRVAGMGGSVSAEHGIGKLKRWLIKELYSPEQMAQMNEIKKLFDPDELIDRGNVFDNER